MAQSGIMLEHLLQQLLPPGCEGTALLLQCLLKALLVVLQELVIKRCMQTGADRSRGANANAWIVSEGQALRPDLMCMLVYGC